MQRRFRCRIFSRLGCRAGIVVLLTLSAFAGAADPPKIDRLFPPGGQRGTTIDVKVAGAGGDGTLQVWSKHGQLSFEFSEKKDTANVTIPDDATPGLHWLRFYNEHGTTDLRPFIVGLIKELQETEPNNTLDESQSLDRLTTTINGVLEKSEDVDLFALNLKAGQTLVACVEANCQLASPMDAVLQLLDAHGSVVAQNDDDHGFDPQIVFPVTKDGTYHLRLFAFPATPNSTIKLSAAATYVYRLTLTTGPLVDYSIPAVVNAQQNTSVSLSGWNLGEPSKTAPVSVLSDEAVVIAYDAALPFATSVVSHSNLVETPATAQNLTLPSTLTGVISVPGEKDEYRLSAKKKQKLTITAAARSMHSQLDPVITVTSDAAKVIKESDDRSREDLDSEAAFTIPADGEYTVTVSDRFRSGGERFFYVLTCEETQPEFSATLKANQFVVPKDKPLEIPVTILRTNSFAEKIDFSVEGLPEGVSAETVTSENEGDSKKSVTLKIARSEKAAAFSGTIQIVGKSQESQMSRVANAPIQNSKQTTSEIWLTVFVAEREEEKPVEK